MILSYYVFEGSLQLDVDGSSESKGRWKGSESLTKIRLNYDFGGEFDALPSRLLR